MRWKPIDYVVACIATTICFVILSYCYSVVSLNRDLTDAEGDRLLSLLLALAAIVSGYVIAQANRHINGGDK